MQISFTWSGTALPDRCLGPGTGLFNSIRANPDLYDDACIDPPLPSFSVKKRTETGDWGGTGEPVTVDATETAVVTYQIAVTNSGITAAKYPAITDRPSVPAGFTLTALSYTPAGGATQAVPLPLPDGSSTIHAPTTDLAPGAEMSYVVTMTMQAADLTAVDGSRPAAARPAAREIPARAVHSTWSR